LSGQGACRVLVLCTGNSARSVLGEALLNHRGKGVFQAHSAGSHPTGKVNPHALATLKRHGLSGEGYESQSWDAYLGEDAAPIDIVLTVCDNAAGGSCPNFPGTCERVHWGLPDPAIHSDDPVAAEKAFEACYQTLASRLKLLCELPIADMTTPEVAEVMRGLADHAA
jgi:arsenate reductase